MQKSLLEEPAFSYQSSSLILYFKSFHASHVSDLWSFTHVLRLYHINRFEHVQLGKLCKEGGSQQGWPAEAPVPGQLNVRLAAS